MLLAAVREVAACFAEVREYRSETLHDDTEIALLNGGRDRITLLGETVIFYRASLKAKYTNTTTAQIVWKKT